MDWQDISTAPKDGTHILVWDGIQCHVVWAHDFEFEDGSPPWFNGDVYVKPTHWMPLPSPPPPTEKE